MAHLAMVATWALIVIGAIWLVILPGAGGYFGITSVWFRLPSTIALALGLGVWLALAIRRPFWRPRSSLTLAFIGSIAAIALSLALSIRPALGADYLAYAVLLTGAYLLLVRLFAHPYFGPRLGGLAVLLCLGLCLWYIPRVLAQWTEFWIDIGRISTPPLRPDGEALAYGNPGTLATVVILLWLASVAHLGFGTRMARAAVIGISIPVAFVVLVTAARGAWVGLAVAATATALVWLGDPGHRRLLRLAVQAPRVRLAFTGGVVAALGLLVVLLPAVFRRLNESASEVRSVFNATAVRMFQDAPITGLGPGMWPVERARYTLATEQDYYIPHAHNLYLQTLAELGLVGAGVGLLVLGLVVWLIARGIRSPELLQRRLALATLFGLVYLATHQVFDFYANLPAVGFAFGLSLARLDALQPSVQGCRTRSIAPGWAGTAVLAVGLIPAVVWLMGTEFAAADGQRATDRANSGDWAGALAVARKADLAAPGTPPYLYTRGLAAAHESRDEESLAALRAAAKIDDYPLAWLNAAAIEFKLGNRDEGQASLDRAMRLGAQNPQVAIAAMDLHLGLGDEDAATIAAVAALEVAPTLTSDPYWMTSPKLEQIWRRAVDEAISAGSIEVALEAERVAEAERIVETMDGSVRASAEQLVRAWEGDASAFDAIRDAAIANPLDRVLADRCHRLAVHARESISGAADWDCRGTAGPGAAIIRVADLPGGRSQLPGPNAPWHFQYVYRRLTPFDELVPGLPHVVRFDMQ
jgi:O-antigen ligase